MIAITSNMVSSDNDVGNCSNNGIHKIFDEVFNNAFFNLHIEVKLL